MAIYEPIFKGDPVYGGGIGKDSPYGKATGLYKPNIVGPGSGRIKIIIKGAKYVHGYFKKYPKFAGSVTGISGGALAYHATSNKYRKTYNTKQSVFNRIRRNKQSVNRRSCCCTVHSSRSKRRRRY